jgi:hypothetical protein
MIDFPGPPLTVGQIFTAAGCSWRWSGTKWVANVGSASGGGGSTTTIGDFPPSTPTVGSGWFDSTDCNLYLWYSDPSGPSQWIPATNIPGPVGPAGPAGVDGFGRNLVHNSLFQVQQRGQGPWTGSGLFTLDRWQMVLSTSTQSVSVATLSDADRTGIGDEAAQFALQSVVGGTAGAGDFAFVAHSLEGVRRTAAKTVTLSFWAKASAGTPKIGLNWAQYFGTGGSPSAQVNGAAAQSVTLSTSWARYTATFAIPSIVGKTLGTSATDVFTIYFWFTCGATNSAIAGNPGVQSATFQIWGVQLEIGIAATALEKPDPRYDLANCQRFYQVGYATMSFYGVSGWGYGSQYPFPVVMRATPTMAISGTPSYTGSTAASISASGPAFFNPVAQSTGTGNWVVGFTWTASADL